MKRQVETKTYFRTFATTSVNGVTTQSGFHPATLSGQGVADDDFIGSKYHAVGCQLRAKLTQLDGGTGIIRFVILWIKKPENITTQPFDQYYQVTSSSGAAVNDVLACFQSAQKGNVKILMDRTFPMGKSATATDKAAGTQIRYVQKYMPINSEVCIEQGQSAADYLTKGFMIMYVVSDSTTVAYDVSTKFYYRDP